MCHNGISCMIVKTDSELNLNVKFKNNVRFFQVYYMFVKFPLFSVQHEPRLVQVTSAPYFGQVVFTAGPAQFGTELSADSGVSLEVFTIYFFDVTLLFGQTIILIC